MNCYAKFPVKINYNGIFEEAQLEWKEIYSLPFKVALGTKSRFKIKFLTGIL